jgi:hypothetical protein
MAREMVEFSAGLEFRRAELSRSLAPTADGKFRADDVTSGQYVLTFDFRRRDPAGEFHRVATVSRRFEVPVMAGGRSDEPLDLGDIEMTLTRPFAVGKPVADFEFDGLDGTKHALGDYRGKFVLLYFWASTNASGVKGLSDLKAAHDASGNDPRLTLLGMSLDAELATVREFLKDKDQPGVHGRLPLELRASILQQHEFHGFPTIVLIGPDGVLLAKDLNGEAIKAAVTKALAAQR